jgi:hypothetical protein
VEIVSETEKLITKDLNNKERMKPLNKLLLSVVFNNAIFRQLNKKAQGKL